MDLKIKRCFSENEVPKNTKFVYDKTSKKRPAWIFVKNLPKDTMFLSTRVNGKIQYYRTYLTTEFPLFLPIDYTKDEMRKFYDRFTETYDKGVKSRNSDAAKFLFKKHKVPKDAKILDLGAGSGISSVPLIKMGYKDITLLDFSKKMISKAKKKKELKNCKFIQQDISKLKIKNKFDVIFSVFSLALSSYFTEKDMERLWKEVHKILKPEGILMILGNDFEPPKKLFKKVKRGKYEIIEGFKAQWYIGKKRLK